MSEKSTLRKPIDIHADIEKLEEEYTHCVKHNDDPDEAPEITEAMLQTATLRVNGEVIDRRRKQRVTLYLDKEIIEAFKQQAGGRGYQTEINEALRQYLKRDNAPLTVMELRRVLREELARSIT